MISQPVQDVLLSKIKADDIRRSRDAAALEALTASLRAVGQLYPIRLRPEGEEFVIVDGHRRAAALHSLGATTVAALIEEKPLSEAESIQKSLISNIQRESLNPVDTARAITRLMEVSGWNASQTANQLGFAGSTVAKYLAILNLPAEIIERIAAKTIPATAAYDLARINDPVKQAELAGQLATGSLTRDALRSGSRRKNRESVAIRSSTTSAQLSLSQDVSITVSAVAVDFDRFIDACKAAAAKAKKARGQHLSFETFLKVARDQALGEQ